MVASFNNFYDKIWVGFCFNIGKRFFLEFPFWSQQKEHRFFSKTVLGIFKIALRLRDWHVSMSQSVKVCNVFNTLTLIQIFWKAKNFFKKLEYRFLVETNKIENTLFPFKTGLSETNGKTNTMATIKWTYHNEWSFCQ